MNNWCFMLIQSIVFVSFKLFMHHVMRLCSRRNNLQMLFLEAANCNRLWWKRLTWECNLFSGNCLDILCWLEGERTNLICNAKSHRAATAASLLTVRPQLVWVPCFHSAFHRLLISRCSNLCLNWIQDILSVYVVGLCRWYNTSRLYTLIITTFSFLVLFN